MSTLYKSANIKFHLIIAFSAVFFCTKAQENNNHFSVSADIVSSYVWRGISQEGLRGGSPNIQPTIFYVNGAFCAGAWSSYSFSGNVKEVDLYATLSLPGALSATVTDYNWNNGNDSSTGYFNYRNKTTGHILEGTLAYGGTKTFPVSIAWNTLFYGDDKKTNGHQAFSTYIEVGAPITPNVKAFLGASLIDSHTYGNNGFAVINLGLKVSKTLKFSDSFNLPLYGIIGANPYSEKAFFIAGITL